MEGGFGFPFGGGDPEDLLRGLREFAEQQAESVQEAQREQFATLTLNTAVELTAAALGAARNRRARSTSRRSPSATRCACSSPRRSRWSARRARASCASAERTPSATSAGTSLGRRRLGRRADRRRRTRAPTVPTCPTAGRRRTTPRRGSRPRHRPPAAGRAEPSSSGSPRATSPGPRSPTPARRQAPERRGQARDRRRARRGDHERGEARAIARAYRDVLAAIERERLDSNISVKLTALGLELDLRPLPRQPRAIVARRGRATATSCASTWRTRRRRDDTLRLYRELREAGHDNVGIVLQAYLRRTLDDIARARRPAAERPALQGHLRRAAVDRVPRLRGGARELRPRARARCSTRGCYVGDRDARRVADPRGAAPRRASAGSSATSTSSRCCSACARSAATSSSREGHRLRVYVPFGEHWYEYSLRRLQENPAIAGYDRDRHASARVARPRR